MKLIALFGEVLFDCFPDGHQVLGGAPFNVAWHLHAFGQEPRFISRIGKDKAADKILNAMRSWGMDTGLLQHDPIHPTGQVQITITNGEPTYSIVPDQAYDFIETVELDEAFHTGTLYHGTLATRSPLSRQALLSLRKSHKGKVFIDVNLRQPWWLKQEVLQLIQGTSWVKLNLEEFYALQGVTTDIEVKMKSFLEQYQLEGLVVTCGAEGALGLNDQGNFVSVSPKTIQPVGDSVGAGDAFSAVLLLGLSLDWDLPITMERAQSFASAMTGQRGATVNNFEFYKNFMASWQLN